VHAHAIAIDEHVDDLASISDSDLDSAAKTLILASPPRAGSKPDDAEIH
jgi:hypothetical protein